MTSSDQEPKTTPDILAEEMRKTALAKLPDKKTGRLAKLFCEQCFQIRGVRVVDDTSVVGPNLDFDCTDALEVKRTIIFYCVTVS
jgi:hypothetical protein